MTSVRSGSPKSSREKRRESAAFRSDAALDTAGSDYIERNRAAWQRWAPNYTAAGRKAWQDELLRWGVWGTPESDLGLLEGIDAGADIVELGCGTASVAGWLARHGFHPVGVDFARKQIQSAEGLSQEFGVHFPLVCGNAEHLDFDHESFDCAISEYGASLWCNPRRWVAEAARLLRPGGRLIFITNSALLITCTSDDGGEASDHLVRDYFGRYRVEFPGDDAVEFHLTHGRWVRLLRACGFVLENLIETRPPITARSRFGFASAEWAQRWPSEEIWVARKEASSSSPSLDEVDFLRPSGDLES